MTRPDTPRLASAAPAALDPRTAIELVRAFPGHVALVSITRRRVLAMSDDLERAMRDRLDGDPYQDLLGFVTPSVRSALERAAAGASASVVGVEVPVGDEVRVVDVAVRPLPLPDDPDVVLVRLEDVSDLQDAARAADSARSSAEEAEDRYRHLFRLSALGVVHHDATGAIDDANPAALAILGADSLEDLHGRGSDDPAWWPVDPSGKPFDGDEHPAMVALRSGTPVGGVTMGIRRLDTGERRWLRVTASPRLDRSGQVVGVFATFEDVTDQWEIERELAYRTAILDAVLDTTPTGFALVDVEHRFVRVNRAMAEINARSVDEHVGVVVHDLLPHLEDANRELFDRVLVGGEVIRGVEVTTEVAATPGVERTWLVDFYPVRVGGVLAGLGSTAVEITERRRLVEMAAELERARHEADLRRMERALAEESETVRLLQQAVLPERLASVPRLDAVARHVSASTAAQVGGDWYDVVPLIDPDRYVVVVGDVAGHGLGAAQTMVQLRHWTRLLCSSAESPAHVLRQLNSAARRFLVGEMATVLVAFVDPALGEVTWATAGHPPLVVRDEGITTVRFHERVGAPIGAAERFEGTDTTAPLGGDALLVAYTDGLVERRGEPLDTGLERLRAAVCGSAGSADAIADRLMAMLLPDDERRDDACLVVVRPR